MKRYLVRIGSGAGALVVTGFFALALAPDAYGHIRRGDETQLPGGCGAALRDAVLSVYPSANIATVQSWELERTYTDQATPLGAKAGGEYQVTMSGDEWWAKVQADGYEAWPSCGEDTDADTVTVCLRKDLVALNTAQRQSHAPLFSGDCVLDDDGNPLAWGDVTRVVFKRSSGPPIYDEDGVMTGRGASVVTVQPEYLTAEAKGSEVARLQRLGKSVAPVAPE